MAEIARRLGVSKATVSRALAGNERVPEARRTEIATAARGLGWRPDARLGYLSALRWRGRSSGHVVIAYLCDRYTVAHPDKRRELQEHAAALGYRLEHWRLDDRAGRNVAARLRNRGVQGVLIDLHQNEVAPALSWDAHSAIVMGEEHAGLKLHRVATDWPAVLEQVRARCVDEGRRAVLLALRRFAGTGLTRELTRAARGATGEFASAGLRCVVDYFEEQEETAGGRLERCLLKDGFDAAVVCTTAAANVALAASATRSGPRAVYALMQPAGLGDAAACLDINLGLRARTALDLLHLELLNNRRGLPAVPVRHLLPGRWLN